MIDEKEKFKHRKDIAKRLEFSDKKFWDELSKDNQEKIIDKYLYFTNIENIGLNNVLTDVKQSRISIASLSIGMLLGIFGSMASSVILKYVPESLFWHILILVITFGLFWVFFKLINDITVDGFRDYKILGYLADLVKKDELIKNKNKNLSK